MKPIAIDNAEHYNWGQGCDGWHLLKGQDLSVIQERVPPGASEVKHYHQRARQFFYILSGVATMIVGDERITLRAGQGIEIPPGMAHQFRNDCNKEVCFLVISCPSSHGDRENLADAL